MKHYAIVKCEKYQETWVFVKGNAKTDQFWFQHYMDSARALINKNFEYDGHITSDGHRYESQEYYEFNLKRYKEHWEKSLLKIRNDIRKADLLNGECVLWEGEVKQERLRAGDNLFIPSIDQYLEIKAVQISPDGTIIYKVDYRKYFQDTAENDRIKAIEQFVDAYYPNAATFEELKNHRYDVLSDQALFDKVTSETEEKLKPTPFKSSHKKERTPEAEKLVDDIIDKYGKQEKNIEDKPTESEILIKEIEFRKEQLTKLEKKQSDVDVDEQWQNIILFGSLGVIVLFVLGLFIGFS